MPRIADSPGFRSQRRNKSEADNDGVATAPLERMGDTPVEQHRFAHGNFDITILSDGFIVLPAGIILPDTIEDQRPEILHRLGGDDESAPFHVNIPLIGSGSDIILVDNGSGDKFQPTAGKLAVNLKAAGIDPASVTKVIFTHIHPDHAGGTILPDGKLLCPNAEYFINDEEWQFWTDPNYHAVMPSILHDFARGAQRDLAAINGRLKRIRPGDEIVSGLQVLDTPGHTPGHVSYVLEGSESLIINGDVAASNLVFFEHPNWHFGFDTNPGTALKTRQRFLDRAASERIKMLGYHWTYPGIGYAERRGNAYQFVPG